MPDTLETKENILSLHKRTHRDDERKVNKLRVNKGMGIINTYGPDP